MLHLQWKSFILVLWWPSYQLLFIFWMSTFLFLFFSHTLHSDHSFPTLHSPQCPHLTPLSLIWGLVDYHFLLVPSGILLRKFFPLPISERVLALFSVFWGIWSILELIVMKVDRYRSIFILIHVDIQFSKQDLLKMLIFLQFMFWHLSQISDDNGYKHSHFDLLLSSIVL